MKISEEYQIDPKIKKWFSIFLYVCIGLFILTLLINFMSSRLSKGIVNDQISNADRLIILEIPNNPNKFQVTVPSLDGTVSVELFVMKEDLIKFRARISELVKEDEKKGVK